jgi:F-type H+-transporting ATPase subunit b
LKYSKTSILQPRFSARIFWIASLAALTASVAVAPLRLAAQDSTPVTSSQPAAAAGEAAKPEAAKSEEEQNNAFRLEGPVVKWTAKTFSLPVTTAADLFDFINFAIIVLAVGIPLYRFLPKHLRQRGEKVRSDIESARKVTEDANSRLSAVEEKLSKLDEEITKFRTEVEQESAQDLARIKSTLEEESARIVAAAEQEITVAAAQARRGLHHFAANLAIDQAAKQLVLTPETDRALIAEFVGNVNNGGQN